jgi:hypothetical protein
MIFVLLITEEERGYEPRTNKQRNKEDKKMLEAMATLILVIVGAVLLVSVMVYGVYVTVYPLSKTVQGGIDAMKAQAKEVEEQRLVGK